jgi:protein SHQ1
MTPNEINEIDNPETTAPLDRTNERIQKENEKFDEDYYM